MARLSLGPQAPENNTLESGASHNLQGSYAASFVSFVPIEGTCGSLGVWGSFT